MLYVFIWTSIICLAIVDSTDDCPSRIDYCKLPRIEPHKDCPDYGFDCSRETEMLKFDLSTSKGRSVITCKDQDALLFVKKSSVSELKCDDDIWRYSRSGHHYTKHALCAKPCTTCSLEVPSTIALSAISASSKGGEHKNSPCTIAHCDGAGLRLLGVIAASGEATEIPEKELRCAGEGWMDKAGNKYDSAICGYNNCVGPTLFEATPEPIDATVSHGAIFCPPGYKTVVDDDDSTHFTLNPLICDATNKWTIIGGRVSYTDPIQVGCVSECQPCSHVPSSIQQLCSKKDCSCQRIHVANVTTNPDSSSANCISAIECKNDNYAPTVNAGGTNAVNFATCTGSLFSTTTGASVSSASCIKYRCKTAFVDVPDVNAVACLPPFNRTFTSCCRADVHSSRITCPRGQTLVYATIDANTVAVETDHLTCAANGSTTYWDPKKNSVVTISGASCRKEKVNCRKCPRLRNVFEKSSAVFEIPGNGNAQRPQPVPDSITNCLTLSCTNTGMQMYINDSPDLITKTVTCNDDGQWHAVDGTIVESVGCLTNQPCTLPPSLDGSAAAPSTGSMVQCSDQAQILKFQIGDNPIVEVGSGSNGILICGSFDRLIYDRTTFLPRDVKVGCFNP